MKAKLSRTLTLMGLSCIFGMTAACANLPKDNYFNHVHLARDQMNRDIAIDVNNFLEKLKAAQDKEGWDEDSVFHAVGIDKRRFVIQDPKGTIKYNTGSEAAAQTKEAIEYNSGLIKTSTVYTINFKEVDKHGALAWPFAGQTERAGFDMELALVFKNGRLDMAKVYGQQRVNGKETDFIWNLVTGGAIAAGLAGAAALAL